MSSLISVVVPAYNAGETIAECIESIQHQQYGQWELWVVDDGSTDATGAVCDSYAASDLRVHVVHQPNKGRSAARLEGMMRAKGEWIAFVDADDKLPVDSLTLLYAAASNDVDIVLGNGYALPSEKRHIIPMSDFRHLAVRGEGTIGVPWGSLYRRSVLTPWMMEVPRHIYNGEDYLFWLRLVFTTERPVAVVYDSVYDKGEEHTSNCFRWTADYCYELNELRKLSIPVEWHDEYLEDMLQDRLANLYSVTLYTPRSEWQRSSYYRDIMDDLRKIGKRLSLKNRLFLRLPSRSLRRLYSTLSKKLR